MEYTGIMTGIGDKETNTNVIKPEYDAALNLFMIGINGITGQNDLVLSNGVLSAGSCHICGYRGIVETDIDFSKKNDTSYKKYIYAKWTINFDKTKTDTFEIVTTDSEITTNVNPNSITSAGTYYLLLYEKEELKATRLYQPNYVTYSEQANRVTNYIAETATATTLDADTNNAKVATTAFVHTVVQKEFDVGEQILTIYNKAETKDIGKITLKRRAKYVVGVVNFNSEVYSEGVSFPTFPDGYKPKTDFYFAAMYRGTSTITSCQIFQVNTNGVMSILESSSAMSDNSFKETQIGYECQ